MKSNQEILDYFGQLLIQKAFDRSLKTIVNSSIEQVHQTIDYKNLFSQLTEIQKKDLEKYTFDILSGFLFNLLNIFEEDDEFKVYYETEFQKVNLIEISDMLKAEPIIENGWIERFSQVEK